MSEIYNYLLPDSDFQNCKSLLEDLEKIESVNKSLQKSTSNLSDAQKLFDALIEQHDELKAHLSADASIIHRDFINFENALVKLTNGDELTNVEKNSISFFERDTIEVSATTDFAERVLESKRRKTGANTNYQDVSWIPSTSNLFMWKVV